LTKASSRGLSQLTVRKPIDNDWSNSNMCLSHLNLCPNLFDLIEKPKKEILCDHWTFSLSFLNVWLIPIPMLYTLPLTRENHAWSRKNQLQVFIVV
jgi:hypothetical protein